MRLIFCFSEAIWSGSTFPFVYGAQTRQRDNMSFKCRLSCLLVTPQTESFVPTDSTFLFSLHLT
jgi:hypothetical protein